MLKKERTKNMKAFLEEYGIIIVAVIVILACIVLAHYFGETIQAAIRDILDDFFEESGSAAGNLGSDGMVESN